MTRARVLTFGAITAVLAAGYGVMFTVLDEYRDEYGIAPGWLGRIVGIGFLASFVAQVFLAPIADRGRARQMVLLGLALNVVGVVGMAVGKTVLALMVARLVMGIGAGVATPAVKRIVISADPANLGHNVGLLLAADVAGFAAGPALSAVLVPTLGLTAPFLVIAALSVLLVPVVLRAPVGDACEVQSVRFAFDLLGSRAMVSALAMGVALFMMIGTFDALWVLVLDDLRASDLVANVGIVIFVLPLIFLGSYGGRLAQRIGPFRLGPFGLALGAGYMTLYGLMPNGALMLTVGVVHAISDGLTVSSTSVAVGMAAPPERQAGAQGMLGAAETLAGGVTAMVIGDVYDTGGRLVAFASCSAVMLVLCLVAWILAGEQRGARGATVGRASPASATSAGSLASGVDLSL